MMAPHVVAPALRDNLPAETPGIVPLLFVTLACGVASHAVSQKQKMGTGVRAVLIVLAY